MQYYRLKELAELLHVKKNTLMIWIYNSPKINNLFKKIKINSHWMWVLDLENFDILKEKIEEYQKQKYGQRLFWNQTAIDCYNNGDTCDGCFYNEYCKKIVHNDKPPMKKTVEELLAKYGEPK